MELVDYFRNWCLWMLQCESLAFMKNVKVRLNYMTCLNVDTVLQSKEVANSSE